MESGDLQSRTSCRILASIDIDSAHARANLSVPAGRRAGGGSIRGATTNGSPPTIGIATTSCVPPTTHRFQRRPDCAARCRIPSGGVNALRLPRDEPCRRSRRLSDGPRPTHRDSGWFSCSRSGTPRPRHHCLFEWPPHPGRFAGPVAFSWREDLKARATCIERFGAAGIVLKGRGVLPIFVTACASQTLE
jgi:hypothetical protein